MANQISPLAFVHPEAKLGDGNIIGPFCYIDRNTVIGDNNVMQNSVTINFGARIGNGNEFFPGASISTKPQDLKFRGEETLCEVGDNNSIRENVTISRGTASKGITTVGNNNLLMENMHIATSQDIPPYIIAGKEPIRYAGVNLIGLRRRGYTNEQIDQIHTAYRLLYSKGVLAEGIEEIKKNLPLTPEIQYIIDFVETSKRGIIR